MSRLALRLVSLLAALTLAALIPACGNPSAPADGKLKVVTTIFAYFDIARAIGGDKASVDILLDPNSSPHDYQASPADRDRVTAAKLVIKNGLGLDDWKVLEGASGELLIISATATPKANAHEEPAASAPADADHAAGHHHDHGSLNPHIWLDPTVQMKAAELIRDAFIRIDPANKATYEANAAKYLADLKALDADFAAATKTFSRKDFIGFHEAYDYLADRYGLEEVAAIQEAGGGMTPAQVDKVIGIIKDKKATVVFAEDAFSKDVAERIVKQTGATLGTLQPLETYRDKNDTYVKLMRENLAELKRTMQ